MLQRIITGVILIALFIPFCVFSHTIVFPILVALLSILGIYELLKCIGVLHKIYISFPPFLMATILPLGAFFAQDIKAYLFLIFSLFFLYAFYMLALAVFMKNKVEYRDAATVYTFCMYVLMGFTSLVLIRYLPNGKCMYLLPFFIAWITDTLAYFSGRAFGKHKLAPEISPKKTVEGSIGGIVLGVPLALGVCYLIGFYTGVQPHYLPLAIVIFVGTIVTQVGDLLMSLLKRSYGIKDYNNIFPGHGGVLDRFDSVIAIAPFILLIGLVFENLCFFG